MSESLVPLCECWGIAEAQAIRASLEARGVTVFIEGEHQRGIMGMVGAAVTLRVMVPTSQLELARELASDVIPDLAPEPSDDDDDEHPLGQHLSPSRRPPADDLVDYRDDDESIADFDDGPELPAKKSMAVALLLAVLGLAVGLLHVYAGEERTGGVLFVIAALSVGLSVAGHPSAGLLLLGVWAVDILRGAKLLRDHNAAIDLAEAAHARAQLTEPS